MASAQELQHIILLYLSSILLIVGIATNSWKVSWHTSLIDINAGLFKACASSLCVKHDGEKTVKAMEVIGLIAAVFCAVAMTVHHTMKSNSNVKKLPKIVFFVSIGGACLVFIGCAMYGFDNFDNDIYPGYSFILTVIGGVILIVGGAASSKK